MSVDALLRRYSVTGTVEEPKASPSGRTLAHGLLRFHTPASAQESYAACVRLAKGIDGRYFPFAFDWAGRELLAGADGVVVVDPARGLATATGLDLDAWCAAAAEEDGDPFGAADFRAWRETYPGDPDPLGFDEAVGYRTPLLLGGEDDLANRERTDRRAYFDDCVAIARQVRKLPEGTVISGPA
ncbi:hypothetical protein C6N75_05630 [Streptomyces solincola]|uniref:T6SS immunity protein Tdi1 C-terminal domain-containing protein n=1 Tax=Streptomyces solincola TaxID=2100817 RepID=A0A2S9Q0I1_9ACTN|nr:hypothetical protein [Streptomyces solincola]PRH80190.1 hypothetical protein C6N75_05630 [Streptomyces solincola]